MEMLKANDLFCGAGGFGTGFKNAGFEIAGAWDFDKYAVQSYKHNVGDHVKQADISQMTWEDMPKADVWTFGFPCQDLSRAKMQERKGLEGNKSKMFFQVMRLLDETKEHEPEKLPKFILAENVPELKGVMDVLEKEYKVRGYRLKAKLVNSKYWGVPQSRLRWFVIGVREDIKQEFIFPDEINPFFIPKLKDFLEKDVPEKYFYDEEKYKFIPTRSTQREGDLWQIGTLEGGSKWLDYMKRVYSVEGPICTFNTCQGGGRHAKIFDPARNRVRRLTPREYARGQGFPDSFEIVVSDSQAYKQFGNAVSVPVAQAIAERIRMFLLSL